MTAEEAGPADGGAIANGAVAAVDRQFRVRLRKCLELRLRDAVAVLAGSSWFSRPCWRRLIQGSVAWPMTMASRVRTSTIRYPFMYQASSSSVIAPRVALTSSTRARIVSSLPWLPVRTARFDISGTLQDPQELPITADRLTTVWARIKSGRLGFL